MREHLQGLPLSVISTWHPKLDADDIVHIPDVRNLCDQSPEKATLEMQDILSLLVVPILEDNRLVGLAGLDRTRVEAPFSDDHIKLLRAVVDVIQSSLMRKEAAQESGTDQGQAGTDSGCASRPAAGSGSQRYLSRHAPSQHA